MICLQAEIHRRHHAGEQSNCLQTTCQLPNTIEWVAERVHQAHHGDGKETWQTCGRVLCVMAQGAVVK